MALQGRELQQIISNYIQLRTILSPDSANKTDLHHKLQDTDRLLFHELPSVLKSSALFEVDDFLSDLYAEYDTFKTFALCPSLSGKNIIGLGGGFSSGKTGFLNSLMGTTEILPENTTPSSTCLTYLVNGEGHEATVINKFGACSNIPPEALYSIGHGFGPAVNDKNLTIQETPAGHIIKTIILETNLQKYHNLVFLDTPGYSHPNENLHDIQTNQQIARQQLNAADHILWFLPITDMERLPDSDVTFLKTLNPELSITLICSKSNDRTQEQRETIKQNLEKQIMLENLNIDQIFFFDAKTPKGLNSFGIYKIFAQWNKMDYDQETFARRFKKLFTQCSALCRKKLDAVDTRLDSLTTILLLPQTSSQIISCLTHIKTEIQAEQQLFQNAEQEIQRIQTEFFDSIHQTALKAGIFIPEEIDNLHEQISDSLQVLKYYNKRHKYSSDQLLCSELFLSFQDMEIVFTCEPGGESCKKLVLDLLDKTSFLDLPKIRFASDIDYTNVY